MEPPGLFQSPLLLAAKMFDVVLQPGKLLDGQLGRGLTQGVVKLAAGVGQRLLGFGRVTGRAGAVPLPCPALRLVHLSGGPGSGAGGGRGLQPLQLPRQPLGLVPQCSLFGGKPLQCAWRLSGSPFFAAASISFCRPSCAPPQPRDRTATRAVS